MGKPAARLGDMHVCPKVEPGPVPHVGGPIAGGSPNVFIGGIPAARVGDMAVCVGPPDKISSGSSGVFINGKAAARLGDSTSHGGKIVVGCPTVLIGDSGGGGATGSASKSGGAASAVAASSNASHLPEPPQSKEEALERLDKATENVNQARQNNAPLPSSPYTTADKMRLVDEGLNEKYLSRVVKTGHATDTGNIGYLPKGAKTTKYWTTTFTQLEYADKDAELIAKAVGIDYDPTESYTLLLIDQEKANAAGDMVSFIPTYDNLGGFAQKELADEFEGQEGLVAKSMTPEYSKTYEKLVASANKKGIDLDDPDQLEKHAKNLGLTENDSAILDVRHKMKGKLGANEQFLGNGMTKDNTASNPITPFGKANPNSNYGPLETFTYDKNPQTLGKLEKAGIITRIPLTSHT